MPKVELGDYKKLGVKKEAIKVSKKEVKETIERILKNFAEKKKVEREAKNGDEIIIDFLGKKDGIAFDGGKAEKFTASHRNGKYPVSTRPRNSIGKPGREEQHRKI